MSRQTIFFAAFCLSNLALLSQAAAQPPPSDEEAAVQMLVPGFAVRKLPLLLHNINNLVYAPDGRLFALGYDGNVFQLEDTDGDGLEDHATFFFKNEKNEIPPSIGMCWGPGGLYIASRGSVLHLRDKGDGTAELQKVASGWVKPSIAAGSSLDAIGIASDSSGSIYFGLGCDAWSAAYKVNKETGIPEYNLYSERGTIIKLSPDWQRREIVCTGMRFPVSLAFNAAGDLFCTDQEGATWLSNGNPFDELLHIQQGRHYGFPPRHPKYLPGVIDEPSVFDYRPQHQSTCGVHFNEAVASSQNIVGPTWWRRDAFVAGESRGKIWRTKLAKTASGYVAQNNLIACLSMLTIDAVPTPRGDLLVACHSGKPDWGTGPQGDGTLFQISYAARDAPQPVLAYAVSPTETKVIFDRPWSAADLTSISKSSRITAGEYVAAGDHFESFRPGYQVVKDQQSTPTFDVPVLSTVPAPDGRSLTLKTRPRTEALYYALALPDSRNPLRTRNPALHELPQRASIDLLTDLTGVEANWKGADATASASAWLPHLDLSAARSFTTGSAEHVGFFELLKSSGALSLRAQLDLGLMLRTAIQPGAKIDFDYPAETVTVVLKAGGSMKVKTDPQARVQRPNENEARITIDSKQNRWLPLEIELVTRDQAPKLDVSWHTAEDERPRAFPLRRILLPWATPKTAPSAGFAERNIPEIAGGDWNRGKQVFFSETASCSKCHQAAGAGGRIGPDLSNLIYRDYASVLKDITQPSSAINPDHLAYIVSLKDGESATGVVLDDTPENLTLGQITGLNQVIPKSKIADIKASSVSLMPEGLWQALNPQQQRDLMTFLMTEPKKNN